MTDDKTSQNVEKPAESIKEPGLRGVRTTSIFKMANFELFVKPNKRIMGAGGFAFLVACAYIAYIRYTDEYKDVPTYTSINDDGTFTRRIKKSRWE